MFQNSETKPNKKTIILRGLVLFFACSFILCFSSLSIILAQDQDITISSNTIWEAGVYTYNDILITNVATLTLNGVVTLNAQNLTIDSSSSICADGKGYPATQGPGAGAWVSGGGGYGGKGGGPGGGSTYGSAKTPTDLGSGGGNGYGGYYHGFGGAGGGAIRLNIFDTLTLNGTISANGESTLGMGGGGSGGSIYIITATLTGTGQISANGGNSGEGGGSKGYGGGGGRIAVDCPTSTFTGKVEAKGGTGTNNGENGTIMFQGLSLDAPITSFNLVEKSLTASTLSEIISTQQITLNDVIVSGDLNGVLNFTNFEIIKIESGSFSGKGFYKGEFGTNLDGLPYKGTWSGIIYFIPSENKIYLKGEISGDINGICEGYLSESIPQSGNFDKYQAAWKINHLGIEIVSVTINLEGTISSQSSFSFTSDLYLYQANMEGNAFGYYTGPLSAVVTHLRLTSENEYQGEGFSIISYNSTLGQGDGWAYNYLSAPNRVEFQGLFRDPILGELSAFLDENKSPKTLSGTIERLDFGVAPQPDLKVKVWGPTRVSPGQTITYIIEYRNDGLKAADNVFISCLLNTFEKYVYASPGVNYSPYAHRLSWKIPTLAAKSSGFFSFQTEIIWGLPGHMFLNTYVFITNTGEWHD